MKKFIFTALSLVGFATASAQNVTLNVRLKPIQTLIINTLQKSVNLDYNTRDDYANGVTSSNVDHLTIYSTGGFQVKVKSTNAALQNGNKTIQVSTVQIKANAGTDPVNGAQYSAIAPLSANDITLVTSLVGGVDKKISVDYTGSNANAYLNSYVAGQNPSIYTTDLTYTIISQ